LRRRNRNGVPCMDPRIKISMEQMITTLSL
jgi:hypothetical protein